MGEGVPCVDGPSMLCDLKADCPGGNDELEEACGKLSIFFPVFFLFQVAFSKKLMLSSLYL